MFPPQVLIFPPQVLIFPPQVLIFPPQVVSPAVAGVEDAQAFVGLTVGASPSPGLRGSVYLFRPVPAYF